MERTEIEKKVKDFLVEELEIDEEKISPEAKLKEDMGIDSLDFVDIVVIVERNFGFKIIDKGQSGKGYSYYIDFYPVDSEGNTLELWQIRFRISDHRQNTGKDKRIDRIDDMTVRSTKSHVLIKSFEIGQGRKFTTLSSAMLEMKRICESLRDGEYF